MAQHDYNIANGTGAAVRSDLNNALLAIVSNNSGATAPSPTYAYQLWADTTTNTLKLRNGANSAWLVVGDLTAANLGLATLASPTFTGTVTIPAGASISGYAPLASPSFTGTTTFGGSADFSGTGYVDLPAGTTAQRPGTPSDGMIRYNTTLGTFEGYKNGAWGAIGGGATGGGSDDVFYENGQTINNNYTLSTNKNAMSAGPVTISSGVTVTVPSGSSWVIV